MSDEKHLHFLFSPREKDNFLQEGRGSSFDASFAYEIDAFFHFSLSGAATRAESCEQNARDAKKKNLPLNYSLGKR